MLLRRKSGIVSGGVILSVTIAAGLSGLPAPSAIAAVASSSTSGGGGVSVKEGARVTISGHVPAQFGSSTVVLELINGKGRQELGMAVSARDGQVSLPVDLGGAGSYKAQWRVIKDSRTAWTSGRFNLTVVGSGKTPIPSGATAIYNIAQRSLLAANASTPGAPRSMRTEDTFVTATPRSGGAGGAAESVAKATTSALDSIGSGLLGGFTGIVYAAPTQWLFSLIFGPSQTQKELTALSQEVTQGFSTVEAQLNQIQAQLASLQIQVTAVQNQVTSANASASAAACDTQMDSAQGYVTDIQAIAGNYKVALSPAWIRQNLVGKTPIAAANTMGAQLFGQTAGTTPAFASGVVQLQAEVDSLAKIMSTGSTGLIATCASAINAGVSTTQASNSTGIFPVGSITSTYYSQLQSIVSYFNSALALGQVMSAEGGKLGALVLAANSISTVGDARNICSNAVANASASDLSCNGIAANVQSTLNTINAGWQSAGASWSQVSGGLLADDAKVGTGSNYITPPQHVWARDIARFGAQNPTSLESASSSVSPLTSVTPGSGPASSTSLANGETWLGLPFAPATTANLGYLVPIANQPAATTTTPAGTLLGQAGLLNAGQWPTNLILTTGESSPFNISTSTSWNAAPNVCSSLGIFKSMCNGNNAFTSAALSASSFVDTQWGVSPGQNMVIGAPPGSSGTILTMANVYTGASASNNNQLCMTPINGNNKSCGPTTMTATYYLQMPTSGVTNNPNWYHDLGQTNTWTMQIGISEQAYADSETVSNESTNILTCPNFVTQAVPSTANSSQQVSSCGSPPQQNQYSWPVVSLQGTGQPSAAGSTAPLNNCAVTSFTSGTDGNASVGNVCADLFDSWMAGALGITTGPVSLETGSVQGTVTPAGNNAAQALLVNTSGSAQQVTLLAGVTSGNAQLAPVVNGLVNGASGSNGVSVKKCSTVGSGIQCDLTIQPGNTALSIPLAGSYSSATLSIALSGNGIYASSNVDLFPYANGVSSLPPAVSNLAATAAPAGSVNSNAGVLYMFADWTAPTATPPVTGYVLRFTSPSGTQSTQTLSASALGSGVNLALPTTQSGTWQVSVAAVNAGGVGPATTTSVTLGTSIPVTPSGLKAVQNANGTLSLTWNPVTSLPALSNYAVQITPPAGNGVSGSAFTVQTSVPSYMVENVVNVGTWNFSLTAVNSLGSSTPANTSLNVVGGALPLPPKAVDLTLGADGWFNAAWQGSDNVPNADSYYLALYSPGATLSTSPVATLQVSSPVQGALIRVPEFYQLAKNSPQGSWFVTVTPVSSSGLGQFAVAQLVVTPSVTKQLSKAQADVQALASAPTRLVSLAQAACVAGNWSYGFGAFGRCVNGVFTQ